MRTLRIDRLDDMNVVKDTAVYESTHGRVGQIQKYTTYNHWAQLNMATSAITLAPMGGNIQKLFATNSERKDCVDDRKCGIT